MKTLKLAVLLLMASLIHAQAATVTLVPFLPPSYPHPIGPGTGNFDLLVFFLPNYDLVSSVNAIQVRTEVFDDSDRDRDEGFRLLLDVPGLNVEFESFSGNLGVDLGALDGTTAHVITNDLTGPALDAARDVLNLTGGGLLIRLNRNDGDFLLNDMTVTADVTMIPEPGSLGLAGAALAIAALVQSRRRAN